MALSKNTHPIFDQEEYANTFYSCEKEHPFVVFTTCFCPMCEVMTEKVGLEFEVSAVESELETVVENYSSLVIKVKNSAPELLI